MDAEPGTGKPERPRVSRHAPCVRPGRHLAVFDIDGTLVRSRAADGECYSRAWELEFGVRGVSASTADFRSSTDSGITAEVFEARLARPAGGDELARLKARFVALLEGRAGERPEEFRPVPGAARALERLFADPARTVAVATGCWRESARLKLARAGLHCLTRGGAALATSDDAVEREDIIRLAVDRAAAGAGVERFERTVYVGDGAWDARAARRLGLCFLGVSDGRDVSPLEAEGVDAMVRDYEDVEAFIAALDRAGAPEA